MPEDARFDILVWTDTKSIQKKGTHDIKSITEKKKKTFDGYPFEGDFFTFSSADLETCGNPSGIPRSAGSSYPNCVERQRRTDDGQQWTTTAQ